MEALLLMEKWAPIPVDVARGVIQGYIASPSDLPARLRQDHPNDFDAKLLAALVESGALKLHREAFENACSLVPSADSDEKKEKLASVILGIWQNLENPEDAKLQAALGSLLAHNHALRALADATVALRQNHADVAIALLDSHRAEGDHGWLQLRAHACRMKQDFAGAAEYFLRAAKMTLLPDVLLNAGAAASDAKRYEDAVWCFDKVTECLPDNVAARNNLAHLYTFVLHDLEGASIQFRELHRIKPADLTYTLNLANCLAQLFQPEESLSLFDEVCRLDNPPLQAVIGRSRLQHALGNVDEAFKSLDAYRGRFSEGLQLFVPRLIYPRISSLDSIQLDVSNPETDHTRLLEVIEAVVSKAADLGEACGAYLDRLGYLPLASPYSMVTVVDRWLASHPECDVWGVVWKWAKEAGTPLSLYHASSVFVLHPERIPEGKLAELWQSVLPIVRDAGARAEPECDGQVTWALRRDLARHYLFYLEAHLPDNDGANIACFSWWLAERVAAIFPDDPKSAKYYRENWVKPALDKSVYLWTTAMSRIRNSTLRSITVNDSSPWATALMAFMAGRFEQVIPKEAKPVELALLNDALVYSLIGALPLSVPGSENATYAQEVAQWHIVQDWAQHLAGDQRQVAEQLAEANRRLCTTEGLLESLKGIADKTLPDQFAVGMVFKSKAYIDPAITEAVWEILKDAEWRRRSLDNADERVLALLLEGFCLLGIQDRDMWFLPVPHYFAEMCERAEDDARRRILFLLVIQASLAADTISAIQRLLHGEKKALFAPYAAEYRDQIKGSWSMFPAWVQGRLRGILASLHVM